MKNNFIEKIMNFLPARYQNTARQFLKFGITGTIGAIVDFTTYNILTRGLGWMTVYVVLGQKIVMANNVSVFLAIVSNFIFNKYWTFRDKDRDVMKQWGSYLILNVVTWVLNQLLMSYFTFSVPLMEAVFGGQKDNAAKVLAIGIILFLNFLGSKFLVFNRPAARQQVV
jgi:putative flippase GtrA